MQLPKDLKDAISALPPKEKDKLIFRLLKHDLTLANRLLFELVSDETVEDQRELVKENLTQKIASSCQYYYSPGYLNMDIRYMSGDITEHVKITKDKYGEVALNLYMITEIVERNNNNILGTNYAKAQKLCTAIIARAFKILILVNKLHEDYFIEFKDDLVRFGKLISENNYLMKTAINNGLDVNWLIGAKIPANIEALHKEIREKGFLR